jgi:isopenicillin-N epimerase
VTAGGGSARADPTGSSRATAPLASGGNARDAGEVADALDRGWEPARLLWTLDPAMAHLNHGAFGAVPLPVQRAQQRLRDEVEADPTRFHTRGLRDRLTHTRRHLARSVGADPDSTALVPNASTGINAVLHSMEFRPGDEVLVTDHGHVPARGAVERLARVAGTSVVCAEIPLTATDAALADRVLERVTSRTRLVVLDHITSATARRFPLDRLIGPLRDRGVAVLVDGAHAPGMLPLDVRALGADFWVGNFHKWAGAPRGTALLSVLPRWRPAMRSFVVSWSEDAGFPESFEQAGTTDPTGALAAPLGLHTLGAFGWPELRRHNGRLAAWGQSVVAASIGADVSALPADDAVSMRVVPLPAGVASTPEAAQALQARIAADLRCEVAVAAWRGQGLLRLSAQAYNRTTDYVRLAEGLPGLLDAVRRG